MQQEKLNRKVSVYAIHYQDAVLGPWERDVYTSEGCCVRIMYIINIY